MNATGDLGTSATPGREARIVARRQRIEARIGAKADGEGLPTPRALCVLGTASPDNSAHPRLADKARRKNGEEGSSEEGSRSKTQVAETRSRIDRIKVCTSPGPSGTLRWGQRLVHQPRACL